MKKTVVVDVKNIALYGGGIAQWFMPLLAVWINHASDIHFLLLGPEFDHSFLPQSNNWEHVTIPWPQWLPRALRHPYYDNFLYPRAVSRLQPKLTISPYHDVRTPKGIPSVISIHDSCLDELSESYSWRVRCYYLFLLNFNLRRATHIFTVSQTSYQRLLDRYEMNKNKVSVVYNLVSEIFLKSVGDQDIENFRQKLNIHGRFILYSGGTDCRKNTARLIQAFEALLAHSPNLSLLITGNIDKHWNLVFKLVSPSTQARIKFAGRLSDWDLRIAYAATDTVLYPSLCEGFGRVCLEAMESGASLACSDLAVMHEVAGDYPCYFDPYDVSSIAAATLKALNQQKTKINRDARFQAQSVTSSFLASINFVMAQV